MLARFEGDVGQGDVVDTVDDPASRVNDWDKQLTVERLHRARSDDARGYGEGKGRGGVELSDEVMDLIDRIVALGTAIKVGADG